MKHETKQILEDYLKMAFTNFQKNEVDRMTGQPISIPRVVEIVIGEIDKILAKEQEELTIDDLLFKARKKAMEKFDCDVDISITYRSEHSY